MQVVMTGELSNCRSLSYKRTGGSQRSRPSWPLVCDDLTTCVLDLFGELLSRLTVEQIPLCLTGESAVLHVVDEPFQFPIRPTYPPIPISCQGSSYRMRVDVRSNVVPSLSTYPTETRRQFLRLAVFPRVPTARCAVSNDATGTPPLRIIQIFLISILLSGVGGC